MRIRNGVTDLAHRSTNSEAELSEDDVIMKRKNEIQLHFSIYLHIHSRFSS